MNILTMGRKCFMKTLDKKMFKKSAEELQEYMMFKRRGSVIPSKKGKGSYKRKNKHPSKCED
jgi:stalled ribosome alternative rescue factor ArfA